MTTLDHALELADAIGPVLPLHPRTRVPLVKYDEASVDEHTIERWFREWPDAGLGLASWSSGVIAIDVEHMRKGGADGFATLRAARGEIGELPFTRTHRTKSGGRHYLYRAPVGALRSAVGHFRGLGELAPKKGEPHPRPGVDVVAGRAVLRWPPTRGYRLELDEPIVHLPAAWLAALRDPPERTIARPRLVLEESRERRYALRVLELEAVAIAELAAGRNVALTRAAFNCGRLCPPLDHREIEWAMRRACEINGALREHGERRCIATIRRAITSGAKHPRLLRLECA